MILKGKPRLLVLYLLHTVSSLSFSSFAPRNGSSSTSIKTSSNSGHISQPFFPLYVSIVMMDGTDWLSLEVNVFICPRDTDSTWNCSGSCKPPPHITLCQCGSALTKRDTASHGEIVFNSKVTQRVSGRLTMRTSSPSSAFLCRKHGAPAPALMIQGELCSVQEMLCKKASLALG